MSSPSSTPATPLPPPTGPEQAALDWFARCDRGLTPEQEAAFEAWLAADPRHAELFNEFDGTLALLDRAGPSAAAATAPTFAKPPPRRAAWRRAVLPLAAAAAVMLGYLGWWRPAHYRGEAATEVGALRTLALPDGSHVTLNTDSAVAVAFAPDERRVRLERGEAHFTVAKQPDRPFIVEAGGVAVRAVGTAFNVRLQRASVEVLVTEGRVQVGAGRAAGAGLIPAVDQRLLVSGEKVVLALPAGAGGAESAAVTSDVVRVSPGQIERELSWQERRLDFEAATLAEMAAEFNRYNRHQLVIADDGLGRQRFGGSFRPDDHAGFVRMLRENFGVEAETNGAVTVLRPAR